MLRLRVHSRGLLAACAVAVTAVTSAHATLTLTQDKLGNIFYTTETVTLPVAGTGTSVQWAITDFYGTIVKSGSSNFTAGATVIQPNLGKRGFFEVLLTEKDGTNVISTKKTTFAVLTPIDVATMADSRFGAMTHFGQAPRNNIDLMPVLARAGIAHARDEQFWKSVETTKGVYTYPSKFTDYMSAMGTQSIQPTVVLNWSNPLYDYERGDYTTPYTNGENGTPNGLGGYANYGLNLLTHYGSQLKYVEVWNEYNAGTYALLPDVDPPLSKPVTYFNMLKKTYETIKPARPDVTVIAGGTVPVAHGFLNAVFDAGAMPYLDAVSVHPYINAEDADLEFSELRNLIKQYNNNQEKPIWATEFSLSVDSLAEQPEGARHVVRIGTQMLNQNVARMFYYPMANDQFFPFRGLVGSKTDARGSYAPNPAYVTYSVFIRQLHGWTPAGRMAGTRPGTYVYKFTSGSSQRYVLWSTTPTTVHLNSPSANLSEMDLMGTSATKGVVGGRLTLQLGINPVYITGTVTSVAEAFNPVVADSVAGYSKAQGQSGWTYGRASLASNAAYSTSNFVPMNWVIWQGDNYRWKGNDTYNFMTSRQAHPTGSWAIRRWTSDIAGTVVISGELNRPSGSGDGTRLRLFVDGVEKLNQFIAPLADLTYSVSNVTVALGSKVDLAIVQEGNSSSDATVATMRITRMVSSPVVLTQGSLTDYSAQTGTPGAGTVIAGGAALELTGNVWRKHPFTYTVTADTMLEFTVDAANTGELLGIGLDADDSFNNGKTTFQIGGNQSDSNFLRVSQTYSVEQGPVTYVIPVGAYFTGAVNYLTFVGDDDSRKAIDATFSNIRVYEVPSADTTAPTVSVSAPLGGATVSGVTPVSATATDTGGSGLAGVQFKLDGVNLGAEDTASPYSISWDTGTAANGSHVLTAVARDAAGNTTTSAPVTVTVSNTPPPGETITKDNADATGITIAGTWTASTSVAGYYGTNYLAALAGPNSVRFAPTIPVAGDYDVYARWIAHTNRATNAPIDVNHAGGTTTTAVNMRVDGGVWVLLGRYTFNAGTAGNVTVRADGANGYVVADAVQFIRQ